MPFSASYANQDVAEAIKKITVQGINLTTPIVEVAGIVEAHGFIKDEVSSQGQNGIAQYFNKGQCSLSVHQNLENGLPYSINYKCKKTDQDVDINDAMASMCAIKNNGQAVRRGCSLNPSPIAKREIFKHPVAHADGYMYDAMITISRPSDSSVTLTAKKSMVKKAAVVTEEPTANLVFSSEIVDADNTQISEANGIYEKCKNRPQYNHVYDCSCYADTFLKKRMDIGYQPKTDAIEHEIKNQCLSVSEAGYKHENSLCISYNFAFKDDIKISPEQYCGCYADKWSELLNNFNNEISVNIHNSLKSQARGYCKDLWRGK